MITAIPNQPLAFDSSRLLGCCTIDPTECLLVDPADTISFQVKLDGCQDDLQLIEDPQFSEFPQNDWRYLGFEVVVGSACLTGLYAGNLKNSFIPTPGTFYEVRFTVSEFTAAPGIGIHVTFGGCLDTYVYAAGEYQFFCIATSVAELIFSITAPEEGRAPELCIVSGEIFERSSDYTIRFVQTGSPDVVVTYEDQPTWFVFHDDRITVNIDIGELDLESGCQVIQFEEGCSGETLISQCVNIGDHDCTTVITACAASNAVGFKGDFSPSIRVNLKLSRPSFEYEYEFDRLSNGRIDRYYADRRRKMELRIGHLGEFGHNFISTLALWDHVYIGQQEYVVMSETYEPEYADVYDAAGGIKLQVEPIEELARKVRCVGDDGGCSPPPNYWVQGTGPNDDYILQEEGGDRILIN